MSYQDRICNLLYSRQIFTCGMTDSLESAWRSNSIVRINVVHLKQVDPRHLWNLAQSLLSIWGSLSGWQREGSASGESCNSNNSSRLYFILSSVSRATPYGFHVLAWRKINSIKNACSSSAQEHCYLHISHSGICLVNVTFFLFSV